MFYTQSKYSTELPFSCKPESVTWIKQKYKGISKSRLITGHYYLKGRSLVGIQSNNNNNINKTSNINNMIIKDKW